MSSFINLLMAGLLFLVGWDLLPSQSGVAITGNVFYGSKATFDPARGGVVGTVRSKDIYLEIPAYKKILEEGIDKESAKGAKLLREATNVFLRSIRDSARESRAVLVVEEGGISGYPVRDLTPLIIKNLVAKLKAG